MTRARTVRDETFDVMRRLGMTRVFGNPGSTEIPFLTDFPDDVEFVLGLHEGPVVGMATGYALGTGRPAFVNLHTAAGTGRGSVGESDRSSQPGAGPAAGTDASAACRPVRRFTCTYVTPPRYT